MHLQELSSNNTILNELSDEELIGKYHHFGDIVFKISSGFDQFALDQYEAHMNWSLEKIGEYFEADRAFLYQYTEDGNTLSLSTKWCKFPIESRIVHYQDLSAEKHGWLFSKINQGNRHFIFIDDLDALPPEAHQEKEMFRENNTRSFFAVVLRMQNKSIGLMGLETVRKKCMWTKHHLALFGIASGVFAQALGKKWSAKKLLSETDLMSVTLNTLQEAVITTNPDLEIIMLNRAAEKITGLVEKCALHKKITKVLQISPEKRKKFRNIWEDLEAGADLMEIEDLVLTDKWQNNKSISLSVSSILNQEEIIGRVFVIKDITVRKRSEEEIRSLGYYDGLTGLYNRAFFEMELLKYNSPSFLPLSIVIADCNGLKIVNDAFGHEEGDRLLCKTAQIIKDSCRKDDIVARIGGDEFAIILPGIGKADVEKRIVERIKKVCVQEKNLVVSPSLAMGIATKERPQEDINVIRRKAEDYMYSIKLTENKSMRSSMLMSLRKSLEERTHETEDHASRMRTLSTELGKKIGLNEAQMTEIALLALLHDIGKISTPSDILNKPGKLNDDEWAIMKKHSEAGYRIAVSSPELAFIADYILGHHERWDGKGYPEGLKRYQIPLPSRMIAVVDAYDAMTNNRSYKKVLSKEEAIEELNRNAGTQFDPAIVNAFIQMLKAQNEENSVKSKL